MYAYYSISNIAYQFCWNEVHSWLYRIFVHLESTKSSTRLRLRGRGRGKTRGTSTTTAASSDTSAETTSKKPVSRRTGGGRFRGSSSSKSSDDDDQTPAGSIQSKVSTRLRPTNRLGVAASGSKSKSTSSNSVDGKKKVILFYS